jgi:hypothetical protein
VFSVPTPQFAGSTESFAIFTLENNTVVDSITAGLEIAFIPAKMPAASLIETENSEEWLLSIKTRFEVPGIYLQMPGWNANFYPPSGLEKSFCEGFSCGNGISKR